MKNEMTWGLVLLASLSTLNVGCDAVGSAVGAAISAGALGDSDDCDAPTAPPAGKAFAVHHDAAGGNGDDSGMDVTVDSLDRIVIAGWSRSSSGNQDMVVWRYNPDGSLDVTLNGQGFVALDDAAGGAGDDLGRSVAIDPLDRILVAGRSETAAGDNDLALWRLNEDGTLDTSFNGQGFVTHHDAAGGNSDDQGLDMEIDAQGRIVVTGYSISPSSRDMVIWRYNPDGTLDASFAGQGYLVYAGGNLDEGRSVSLDSTGRIIVTGWGSSSSAGGIAVWRYLDDGTPDASFAGQGVTFLSFYDMSSGDACAVDHQDRIVVTGQSTDFFGMGASDTYRVIARLNADGTLDGTFNGTGYILDKLNVSYGSVTHDRSGNIVCAGVAYVFVDCGSVNYAQITRFTPDGMPDKTVSENGMVLYRGAAGGSNDSANSVTHDSVGRIVTCGSSLDAARSSDMAVWRYPQ